MSDILIRGMDMPENCDKCIYSSWSNFYQIYVCNAVKTGTPLLFDGKQIKSVAAKRSGRADNCPIIQIGPHGRLVDADDCKKSIYKYFDFFRGTEFNDLVKGLLFSAHILGDAPTVIPKDKDGKSDA